MLTQFSCADLESIEKRAEVDSRAPSVLRKPLRRGEGAAKRPRAARPASRMAGSATRRAAMRMPPPASSTAMLTRPPASSLGLWGSPSARARYCWPPSTPSASAPAGRACCQRLCYITGPAEGASCMARHGRTGCHRHLTTPQRQISLSHASVYSKPYIECCGSVQPQHILELVYPV